MLNDEKRGVEEQYVSATTTSDLRCVVDSDTQGAVEIIAAAGMSKSLAGSCFIRLHGEWSSAEKPRLQSPEAIRKLADSLTFDQLAKMRVDLKISSIANLKPSPVLAEIAAKAQARAWYITEVEMLLGKLKSFRSALDYMVAQLGKWDKRPELMIRQTCTEVLIWWLDKKCLTCNGTKWKVAAGTNRHSNQPCMTCRGTGESRLPRADDGRRMANFLDDCCQVARTSIKSRLRRSS